MFLRRLCKTFTLCKRTIIRSPYADITFKKETIAEAFLTCCEKYSNRIALIDYTKNISYTYSDLARSIKGIASALTKKGLQQGSVVGIIATNCPEFLMLESALSSIGCTVMLCNPNYTKREIIDQIKDSKSTTLFVTEDVIENVSQAASEVPFVKDLYLIGNRKPEYKSVEDLMNDSGNMNPIGNLKLDVDNHVAYITYSSGTTGLSKGIMLTHKNLVSNFYELNHDTDFNNNKIMILPLPMYHVYGNTVVICMSIYSGSTIVFLPKFEPINYFAAIEKYKISILNVVPFYIFSLLNHPQVSKYNLSSIEKCICSGSPLDAVLEKRFVSEFGIHMTDSNVHKMYGSTECLIISHTFSNSEKLSEKKNLIGRLVTNVQCKVVDIFSREEVDFNKPGEIMIRSPAIMKGYLGKPVETEKLFENGWLKTGDLGHYDSENNLYISARIKDMIKVNDFQVIPAELEEILLTIPGITDCAVIGVPDEKCGQVPKAFVVRNKNISEKEIYDFIANNLSSQQQLKGGIKFISQIPRTLGGKILRRLLK